LNFSHTIKIYVAKVRNSREEYPNRQKKRILAQQKKLDAFSLQFIVAFCFTNSKIMGFY
jgi:hypothetical protein